MSYAAMFVREDVARVTTNVDQNSVFLWNYSEKQVKFKCSLLGQVSRYDVQIDAKR